MGIYFLAHGKKMYSMERVFTFTAMGRFTKVAFRMDLWKVKVFTTTMIVLPIILERGLRDKNMARGLTTARKKSMREGGTMDKDMVRATISIS